MAVFGNSRPGTNAALVQAQIANNANIAGAQQIQEGHNGALRAYDAAEGPMLAEIGQGGTEQRRAYGVGAELYRPYAQRGEHAAAMQEDMAGLNGPEGRARAEAAFRASPGYQWRVSEALDQTKRAGSAGSGVDNGNSTLR